MTLTDENETPLTGKKIVLTDNKGRVLDIGITNRNGQINFIMNDNGITIIASFSENNK